MRQTAITEALIDGMTLVQTIGISMQLASTAVMEGMLA